MSKEPKYYAIFMQDGVQQKRLIPAPADVIVLPHIYPLPTGTAASFSAAFAGAVVQPLKIRKYKRGTYDGMSMFRDAEEDAWLIPYYPIADPPRNKNAPDTEVPEAESNELGEIKL